MLMKDSAGALSVSTSSFIVHWTENLNLVLVLSGRRKVEKELEYLLCWNQKDMMTISGGFFPFIFPNKLNANYIY